MEEFEEQFVAVSSDSDKSEEDRTRDTVEHEEVDPFRPVSVQVMQIDDIGFDERKMVGPANTRPPRDIEASSPAEPCKKSKGVTKKKEKPAEVVQVQEKVPAPVKKKKPLTQVIFEGPFGKIKSGYLDVYHQGVYLILVEDIANNFSYTPPESEDSFFLTIGEDEFEVISPGIYFDMLGQGVKTTVLLKIGV